MTLPSPRPVTRGSRLAVIAPAGPFNHDAFRAGIEWLEARYEVSFNEAIFEKTGYLAGSDERRLCELTDAINDPDIDAIICARGGFGTTRLLPDIDLHSIKAANKQVVGFSDITALHSLWAQAGVRSVHAPMVAALGSADERIRSLWIEAVEHPDQSRQWSLEALNQPADSGTATGRFCGGNLAVLGALNGTPYAPPLENSILFLEDVGERPYRIDRMLTTLKQSGWFEKISGLVLGTFTEGDPGPDGVALEQVLEDHFSKADFPVLAGLQSGHISENLPLNFGSRATIADTSLRLES